MTEILKEYKVKDGDDKYLTFDFNARTGAMNPMWCAPSMAYSFTEEEAKRLACVHEAVIVSPAEFKADYDKFIAEVKRKTNEDVSNLRSSAARGDGFGTHTYYGNGKRR